MDEKAARMEIARLSEDTRAYLQHNLNISYDPPTKAYKIHEKKSVLKKILKKVA